MNALFAIFETSDELTPTPDEQSVANRKAYDQAAYQIGTAKFDK